MLRRCASIDGHPDAVRRALPFHRVRVETLREDWPGKRQLAEQRVRAFVRSSAEAGHEAIVIPFRVHGFGPYAEVLEGLGYVADGQGLLPHDIVTEWIARQARMLGHGPFASPAELRDLQGSR